MPISLAAFLPLVRAYAPEVPNPVAEQQLRLATREFCKETRCWREVLTVAITANPFTIGPAYSTVVAVQIARFGGVDLTPADLTDIPLDQLDDIGTPEMLVQIAPDTFRVYPFEAGDLIVSVYLAPQEGPQFGVSGATTLQAEQGMVPDFLFHEHAMAIAHGALAKIRMMPNQPFTDGAAASFHAGEFAAAKNAMFGHQIKGKQRAKIRTKPQFM